jgi:glycine cleavage system H protein
MTVLFVIATIIIFLTIDWFLHRRGDQKPEQVPQVRKHESFTVRLPEGIFFAPSHTWLNLFPSGKLSLGVDDFIARLLNNPKIILLKNSGDQITKGEPLILLKEGEHRLTVRSPIDGRILRINSDLVKDPSLLKENLFSNGWGYLIQPNTLSELKGLLLGAESRTWIRQEFQRLKDILAGVGRNGSPQPAFLQDGGQPIAGALDTMDDSIWQQLDNEFLQVR